MKVAVWVGLAVASVLIEAELTGWGPRLHRAIIRRAAAPLPKRRRERCIEEWYRELEELPNAPVTRLTFALSLLLRRGSLARGFGVRRTVIGFTRVLKQLGIAVASVGPLIVVALITDARVTTVSSILVFAIPASLYVLSLWLNPWVKCSKCKNEPKRWVSTYGHVCPVCKGTGIELRFGRRFIFGEPAR